ncbi:MAG: PKD domain-containing protein [Methanoregula sp.]
MKTIPVFWGFLVLITIVFLVSPVSADKPVASFISNASSGTSPLSVQFMDSSLNSPTSWTWLFGDSGTSTSQNPTHTYTTTGTYTVTLIATNSAGSDTLTKTGYITATKASSVPGVAFVANVTSGSVPLSVQFLDSSTNSPTAWLWSFGDGGTSILSNPVHTYATDGTYTVTLTATNSAGSNTISKTNSITASKVTDAPAPLFKSTVSSGYAPLNVQFVDASGNSPNAWVWSFGDGSTSMLQNPTHTYTTAGSYTVTLTATNAVGSNTISQSGYITVNAAIPSSSFTTNVTTGVKPLTVQFTDTSGNAPTGWYWTFGEGGTSTSQNPVYTFTSVGTYSVSLGASNTAGSNTTTKSKYITVTNVATSPIASFTADIQSGTAPLSVQFTDSSTNSPTGWQWSFGDGIQNTEQNPSHIYTKSGTYSVSLMALNTGGHNTTIRPGYISVSAPAATATPTQVTTTLSTTVQPTETRVVTETTVPPASGGGLSSWTLPLIGGVILVLVIIALVLRAGGRSGGGKRRSRGRDL